MSDPHPVSEPPTLDVRGLTVGFDTDRGLLRAVDDVSFVLPRGGTLGLVGESGSGKSVTSLSLLNLLPSPQGRILAGSIRLQGRELVGLPEREWQKIRGARIATIFQEPMTSLNPVYSVGAQIVEAIRLHRDVSRREARARAIELLRWVGIPDPTSRIEAYPHQLSGGMRQRVMIAMALSCEPEVLIADEPTTALDVTIQAQILELLWSMQQRFAMSVLLITHDLGVVAHHVQRVAVMYAGRIVEEAPVEELFRLPLHPYSRGLLRSIPPMGTSLQGKRRRRLPTIEGAVPSLLDLPPGCRFGPRCELHQPRCSAEEPSLREIVPGRLVRCHFAEEWAS
ncbi:MAG: ABC transporter ATP-binding protein [Myxococcales bacterium]|nr:ABC transporter ATP-binding protein [Polyangiaceae bacterium]MDW8247771.1 ABC transporter ATP-binding protein [Myxococcales bacterium]